MATDIKLDQNDGTFLVLEGRVLKVVGSDLILDSPDRRKGGPSFRRALVHDQSDGLTVNFNGDYPGGVRLVSVAAISPLREKGLPGLFLPNLVIQGGISYQVPTLQPDGGQGVATVILTEELNKLESQINELDAKLGATEVALQAQIDGPSATDAALQLQIDELTTRVVALEGAVQ